MTIKRAAVVYLFAGLPYAAGIGYFTHTALSKLADSTRSDEIRSVESTGASDDELSICAQGAPAGDLFGSRYQISFPLAALG